MPKTRSNRQACPHNQSCNKLNRRTCRWAALNCNDVGLHLGSSECEVQNGWIMFHWAGQIGNTKTPISWKHVKTFACGWYQFGRKIEVPTLDPSNFAEVFSQFQLLNVVQKIAIKFITKASASHCRWWNEDTTFAQQILMYRFRHLDALNWGQKWHRMALQQAQNNAPARLQHKMKQERPCGPCQISQ